MARVWVVGSGASGVHFALTLLEKGVDVTMIDVGRVGPEPVQPEASLNSLKETLEDPTAYFLGQALEGVSLPNLDSEYYGIPPGREFILESLPGFSYTTRGFAPLFSFAQGGLAEAWTGGSYPLDDRDLSEFPFGYSDVEPCYSQVAARIGITGVDDDLSRFFPGHDHLLDPLELDLHSARILEAYERSRTFLNNKLGCFIGRTRVATLSHDMGPRKECAYLGRCLWGCPIDAIYTPSQTLKQCMTYPGFDYLSGLEVRHFRINSANRVAALVARPIGGGEDQEFPVDRVALAAGTLFSSKIFMHSVLVETGQSIELKGLMDNRQVLVPFLNLSMLGQPFSAESYQYHLLGMALEATAEHDHVHGQITTLKTALMHPILQRLPFDLRTSIFVGRALHAALGIVNVNFSDTRRDENYVALTPSQPDEEPRLAIRYSPSANEPVRMSNGLKRVHRALRKLGCIVPPGMSHVRPMGASVHYAGTIPMSSTPEPWTTTEICQSRDFENLFFVDGTTFPSLPAKNVTFTLMANAIRVAKEAF